MGKLANDKKLEIYALFKQATVGNVNTERPGVFDLKGKAKWDAWKGKDGVSQEEAMQQYIDLVRDLLWEAQKLFEFNAKWIKTLNI